MSATRVQTKTGNGGGYVTAANLTFDSATTSGNTIVVALAYNNDTAGVASVSDNKGNTFYKAAGGDSTGDTEGELWYAYNITGGSSHQITATMSANSHDIAMVIREYAGLTTTDPLDKTSGTTTSGTSHTSAATATTTQANELVVGMVGASANSTYTFGAGYSNLANVNGSDLYESVAMEDKDVTSTGTQQATITSGTSLATYFVVATFKEAASSTLVQEGFAFGDDNGSESAHTLATQDTNITAPVGTKTVRALIDATGSPSSNAYKLKYQKNGSGGYVDVPVGATSPGTTPVLEAGDCTESGNNTATTSWSVAYPAYVAGDLLIFHVASDANVTHNWPSTGPNGETIVTLKDSIGGTAQRASGFYFIGSATTGSGTLTVTPSSSEQWTAVVLKVPAGEFDATTPIQTNLGEANDTGADANWETPTWTADARAGGRIVCFAAHDTVTTSGTPSGWTTLIARDRGAEGCTLAVRDDANTASESIASASFPKTSETDSSFGYVINAPIVENEVYISTSGNVAGGGEATTARLAAPSGKTTGDFTTGRRWDDENGSDSIDIASNQYTELEWVITIQSPATTDDYYDFRVYDGDTPLDTYTATPRWTIGVVVSAQQITKSLQYTVERTPSATSKSLAYTVRRTPTATTKTLVYAVKKTPSAITKSLQYVVLSAITTYPVTKGLSYAVAIEHVVTKSLAYSVTAENQITKSLQYALTDGTTYSMEANASYPTTAADLSTVFSEAQEGDVETDDGVYVTVSGASTKYLVHQFRIRHQNTADPASMTWRGKVSTPTTVKPVYLSVWDEYEGAWIDIDSDSGTAADTEFELSGSVEDYIYFSSTTDYYKNIDGLNYVIWRVWQAP